MTICEKMRFLARALDDMSIREAGRRYRLTHDEAAEVAELSYGPYTHIYGIELLPPPCKECGRPL